MLILIHGDDIAASRTYFTELKQQHRDHTVLDGHSLNLTDLAQMLEGGGLFSDTKTLFIEQFFTKKKIAGDFKQIVSYINAQAPTATIILWEGKELDRTALGLFKGSSIKVFKLPQSLFTFLDAIRPQNGPQLVQLFHQTLNTMEEDAIFYMLIRHFRILLGLISEPKAEIEELKRLQDWQRGKLEKQASAFSKQQLINLYQQLYDLEYAHKTGGSAISLASSIDIFLLET